MKCPNCQTVNLNTAYRCVHCGKVLHSMKVVTRFTIILIITALLQLIVIVAAVILLRTGYIAAYYLKKGEPHTAVRIISRYSAAEDTSAFQKQLEKSVQSEVEKYESGESSPQEAISRLNRYSFSGENSRAVIDDAVQKLQAEQQYAQKFDSASKFAVNLKYKDAVAIRQSMLDSYPDRSDSIEERFLEIDRDAISALEKQIKELSEDENSELYTVKKNNQYDSLIYNLEYMQKNALTDQTKEKAHSMLESLYKEWLEYNEKNHMFFEENGALEIAAKYDAFCSGEKNQIEANRKCIEYYSGLLDDNKPSIVYRNLLEHKQVVDNYSKLLNTNDYQTLMETAQQKWETEIKDETISLTNQYREEKGLGILERKPELDQLSETLLESLDKWEDSDYVSNLITESVEEWTYARRIIYEDCYSVSNSIYTSIQQDDEYILWNDAAQIGIGVRFHENDALFDCVMVLLY